MEVTFYRVWYEVSVGGTFSSPEHVTYRCTTDPAVAADDLANLKRKYGEWSAGRETLTLFVPQG